MGYERCGELPLITSRLVSLFHEPLRYLDIGSGEAVYPSYVLRHSQWDVTCVDKFSWVQQQWEYARKVMNGKRYNHRFHVHEQDFLASELPEESFDIITNISVIEHFEGTKDTEAMMKSARLLKPGGLYILTTLINDKHFREFFVRENVYGETYRDREVFFQRHYDIETLHSRLLAPSGLEEVERLYFGDYGFQFLERFMVIPWPWKPVKTIYQWASPLFARRFLTYRDYPVSREKMHMFTSSGAFLLLRKKVV
jgi:SAM-dependent methyltransferase